MNLQVITSQEWEAMARDSQFDPRFGDQAACESETLTVWLDTMRRKEAERLCKLGLRVKEISHRLGYRHSSSFCRWSRNALLMRK